MIAQAPDFKGESHMSSQCHPSRSHVEKELRCESWLHRTLSQDNLPEHPPTGHNQGKQPWTFICHPENASISQPTQHMAAMRTTCAEDHHARGVVPRPHVQKVLSHQGFSYVHLLPSQALERWGLLRPPRNHTLNGEEGPPPFAC